MPFGGGWPGPARGGPVVPGTPFEEEVPADVETLYVSIVMPALNEEADLEAAVTSTLAGFDRFGLKGEVIVVDDGSTDRTAEIADRLARENPRVRAVHHPRPQGIGASFWEGVDLAQGNAICMLPGDDENDPEEIFRYAPLLEHVDIVVPFVFNKQARSLFRNGLSYLYRFIVNTTFLMNLNYTNGTVFYRRSLLQSIESRSDGFFFQTDILIRSLKRGYLFAEVPYRLRTGKGGQSKAVSFPALREVVRGYLRLVRDLYWLRNEDPHRRPYPTGSATEERRRPPPAAGSAPG